MRNIRIADLVGGIVIVIAGVAIQTLFSNFTGEWVNMLGYGCYIVGGFMLLRGLKILGKSQ
jgi:hypothetical protein